MVREKLISFRGGRTQAEMARRYGVTHQAWGAWERGEKTPTATKMKQIEVDSGIPMEEIFFDVFCNIRLNPAKEAR